MIEAPGSFKMCFALLLLGSLILGSAAGQLTLSPMSVAPVCRVGDPLQLTCTASVEFIRWSIVVTNEQGMEEEITVSRNSRDSSPPPRERMINSTKFTFSRISAGGDLPLISTLAINSIGIDLNGTVVHCRDAETETSISTTINIIDTNNDLYAPRLSIASENFLVDNVIVTVEWTQQAGAVYTTKLLPRATSSSTGSNSRRLTLSYNTGYNFSMVATTPCNPATTTAFIELNYAKCEDPNVLLQLNNNSALKIEDYDDLIPVEGSTIRFSCPPGLELTGPDSATCTEYGEWEPDPRGIVCNVSEVTCENPLFNLSLGSSLYILNYSEPAVVGTIITFNCSEPEEMLIGPNTAKCMNDGQWLPHPNQLQISCKASCGAPETHSSVNYSSYNSTLEGARVSFWCTDMPFPAKEFISICQKNASWTPNPVRLCTSTSLKSDAGDIVNRTAIIAGGSFGALVILFLVILIVVGATIYIKKGSFPSHRQPLTYNSELDEERTYNVLVHNCNQHINKETVKTVLYADVEIPNKQSTESSLDLDVHKVEYTQLNHKAKVSIPTSTTEKSTNEDNALNLDSLLIQLQDKVTQDWHQFGEALGIEKEVLHRCLNSPPEQSIIEILDHWLRRDVEQRSWMEIARALRQINYYQLAEDIENIGRTGKLLVEVNIDDVPHSSQFDDELPPPLPPKKFEEESQYDDIIESLAAPPRPPKPPKPWEDKKYFMD